MSLRIKDAPELNYTLIRDATSLPTGGSGDYSVTMLGLYNWLVSFKGLVPKQDLPDILKKLNYVKLDLSIYKNYKTLKYDNTQPLDRFGYNSLESAISSNYGGVSPTDSPVVAPYVSTTYFRFFDQSNQNNTITPLQPVSGSSRRFRLPIADIQTFSSKNAILPTTFTPVEYFSQGITTFKYSESTPITTTIDADIKIYMKLNFSDTDVNIIEPPTMWLVLSTTPKPEFEHNGNKTIAIDGQFKTKDIFKISQRSNYLARGVTYSSLFNEIENNVEYKIYNGFIPPFSTRDLLIERKVLNRRTTNWLTVPESNKVLCKTQSGNNTDIFRLQTIDVNGVIKYEGNDETLSNGIINFNTHSVMYRVTYNFDTIDDITLKDVPNDQNSLSGLWSEYSLQSKTPLTFHPNYEYSFEVWVWEGRNLKYDDRSFFVERANLSLTDNSRFVIQNKYKENTND